MYVEYDGTTFAVEPPCPEKGRVEWLIDPMPTKAKRKSIKAKAKQQMKEILPPTPVTDYSLGSLDTLEPVNYFSGFKVPQRSTNMYNEMKVQEVTAEDTARQHLRDRLYETFIEKMNALQLKYGITETQPKTLKELDAALKAGQYTIKDLDKETTDPDFDPFYWRGPLSYVRFTLVPMDQKGYGAAYEILDEARAAVKDIIICSSPADGLKAYQDFAAKTFS